MKQTFVFATLGLLGLVVTAQGQQTDDSKKPSANTLVTRDSSLATGGEAAATAWIPFAVERDIEPGSPLDFSWIAAAHAPCGVHGRIVVRDGHFEFEKRPGEPVRFWGVNISSSANFPDVEKTDAIASHLARLGYNAVRLHHHDGGLVGKNPDAFCVGNLKPRSGDLTAQSADLSGEAALKGSGLQADALRRMDALVAACAKHGLYVITDIYVSRPVSWRACGIDRDGTMTKGQFKHLAPIHDGAFSNWCAFASAWLNHTNVFTGVRFADDPALITVALINEGNLDNGAGPEPFVSLPCWKERWTSWLAERAKTSSDERKDTNTLVTRHPSLFTAGEIKDFASIPDGDHWQRTRHIAAFSRFLADVEADFEARAVRFLRKEIGLKTPISNMSAWMQPPEYQGILAGPTQDYVEGHSYCDHPTFPERQWGLPCRVGSENPVRQQLHSMGFGAMGPSLKRIFGKPFCVTEFNYCAPNPHRGAGGLLFGAEAAAQDWSGAWRFDWASSKFGIEQPCNGYCGLFAFNCDPLRQASDHIAQMLFLRGDLAPCAEAYAVLLPPSKIIGTFDGEAHQLNTPWPELTWRARLGTVWAEEAPAWARWVDPYPDYYKRKGPIAEIPSRDDIALDREAGWFKVATSRTCAVFAEGGVHTAGVMRVEIAGRDCSPTNHSSLVTRHSSLRGAGDTASATVWASSLDGKPLADSAHILVGMLTDLRNTGMEAEDGGIGNSSLSNGPTILVRKWGTLPYLVRAGKARVELATTDGGPTVAPRTPDQAIAWRCYALSQGGRRRFEVPCEVSGAGPLGTHIALTLDTAVAPEAATFFWELVRQ